MGILILMVYTAEKNVLHKSLFAQQRIAHSKRPPSSFPSPNTKGSLPAEALAKEGPGWGFQFQNVLKKLEINGPGSGYMRRDQIIPMGETFMDLVS